MILAIETSAGQCAAALLSGTGTLALRAEPMAKGQAERLMPMIAEAMAAAGLLPPDLGAVAACTGPGNFTGVRIGVAAARGLALALGIPAVGVARLDALAAGAPDGGRWMATAGAPRGALYAQPFATDGDGGSDPLGPLVLGPPEALAAEVAAGGAPADGVLGAGEVAGAFAAALGLPLHPVPDHPDPVVLGRLGARRLAAGPLPRPAPVYPNPPDAAPPSEAPPRLIG